MGVIHQSRACLRIFGADLKPDEVSRLLHCTPTVAQRTGEVIRYQSGRERTVRRANWRLEAANAEPEDINGQVRSILSKVESAPDIWQALIRRFDVDMFCGLFMREANSGFSLAPNVMMLLGERGITIDFDIYAADEGDDVPSSP